MTKPLERSRAPVARPAPRNNTRWREVFLEKLAETSNVSASAAWAHVTTSQVYASRRGEPEFARRWQAALCEGYDNLEMELLYRLRTGDTAAPGGGKFEYAVALRLLAAHRESAARERALRDKNLELAAAILAGATERGLETPAVAGPAGDANPDVAPPSRSG